MLVRSERVGKGKAIETTASEDCKKQAVVTNVNNFDIDFLNDNAGGRISFKIYTKCFC